MHKNSIFTCTKETLNSFIKNNGSEIKANTNGTSDRTQAFHSNRIVVLAAYKIISSGEMKREKE